MHGTEISLFKTNQPLVAGKDDRVEHGLIEEAVAHPLTKRDMNTRNRIHKGILLLISLMLWPRKYKAIHS